MTHFGIIRFAAALLTSLIMAMPAWSADRTLMLQPKQYLFLGNANYPPFIYQENGQAAGLVVDITRAVMDKGEIGGKFEAREWKQAQSDVRTGSADALVLINKNAERESYLDFSAPLITSEFVFFRKFDRTDIIGVESLSGKVVGVERGGYSSSIMRRFPGIPLQEVADLGEGFDLLDRGAIDALITERWAGMYALSFRQADSIAVVNQPVETSVAYIAVRKGNSALMEKINHGLERIERDGTRQAIFDRWSGKQILYVTREKINYYRVSQWLSIAVILLLSFVVFYSRKLARLKRQTIEKQNAELELRVANRTRELLIARAEAERATASRTQFMTNASHEMRSPLQSILGFAMIGKHKLGELSEKELAECFDHITEAGQRMHRLVESMLALAEKGWKEHRTFSDDYVPALSLDTLAAECIETIKPQAEQRKQSIALVANADAQAIDGDAVRLRQVMFNLIENAVRYSPIGSGITLKISKAFLPGEGPDAPGIDAISLAVVDEGPGIPVAELSEIFEPFYQGSHTATKAGGTGLGLPLCRKIVEQHGGTLKAINRPEGGAIFEVRLPCSALPKADKETDGEKDFDVCDIAPAQLAFKQCSKNLLDGLYGNAIHSRQAGHGQCPFGLWLSGPGQPFSLFQQYHELGVMHEKFHAIAAEAGKFIGSGQEAEGHRILEGEFAAVSREINVLLNSFQMD